MPGHFFGVNSADVVGSRRGPHTARTAAPHLKGHSCQNAHLKGHSCQNTHLKGYSCQNMVEEVMSRSAQLAMRRSEADLESEMILGGWGGGVGAGFGSGRRPGAPQARHIQMTSSSSEHCPAHAAQHLSWAPAAPGSLPAGHSPRPQCLLT